MAYHLLEIRTLEEDMTAFPEKTEKEVREARSLWDSGTIKISSSFGSEFVSKMVFAKFPLAFTKLVPSLGMSSRSWPCIQWNCIFDKMYSESEKRLWNVFQRGYLKYWYTLDVEHFQSLEAENVALFGEAINDHKIFNLGMANLIQELLLVRFYHQREMELLCDMLRGINSVEAMRQAYDSRKLVQYTIDRTVWEWATCQTHSPSRFWNSHMEDFIVERKNSALLRGIHYPPFHEWNRQKYLLPEPDAIITTIKANEEKSPAPIKREASPGGERHDNKRARIYEGASEIEVAVKKEVKEDVDMSLTEPESQEIPGAAAQQDISVKQERIAEMSKADTKIFMDIKVEENNEPKPRKQASVEDKSEKKEEPKLDSLESRAMQVKQEVIDVEAEPELQVYRVRRVKTEVRRDVFDLTDD